jgi:phosphoribosylformylglycinamidine synthase PurS subunit
MGVSMTARVYVTPKSTVLDPQGQTIRAALNAHGHASVSEVRQGKYFEIRLAEGLNTAAAAAEIDEIAREVLSNPVIEEYRVEILP